MIPDWVLIFGIITGIILLALSIVIACNEASSYYSSWDVSRSNHLYVRQLPSILLIVVGSITSVLSYCALWGLT